MKAIDFGKRLKELRKQKNLRQEELADLLGCTNTTISKWENNVGMPDLYYLKRISEIFNTNLDSLLKDTPIFKKKHRKEIILITIIVLEAIALLFCLINLKNKKALLYEMKTANEEIKLHGYLITQHDLMIFNIYDLQRNNDYTGTKEDIIPEGFQTEIKLGDDSIMNKEYKNSDRETLSEIISHYEITFKYRKTYANEPITIYFRYLVNDKAQEIKMPINISEQNNRK